MAALTLHREDLVGKAIASLLAERVVTREELYLQTKFTSIAGHDPAQPLPYAPQATMSERVRQSFAKSLENLGVEYVDSVVLHAPLPTREETLTAYRTLESIVDEGKIRVLGISNCYDPDLLQWLIGEAHVKINIVQNRWHEGNGWDWDVYEVCQANGIRYQSFWTFTGSPQLLANPLIIDLASKYALSPEQTLYKLCQIWNITPLCGSTTLGHVKEALAVEDSVGLVRDTPEVVQLWEAMHQRK
ncbi:hypothetical protein IAT38_003657 [Cryptococcus sp. DSM 104549]